MARQALELQHAQVLITQLERDNAQLEVQASHLLRSEAQHAQQAKVAAIELTESRLPERAEHILDVANSSTGLIKANHRIASQVWSHS